eukprot:5600123-Lingulodinium_polyedra.AAC.1
MGVETPCIRLLRPRRPPRSSVATLLQRRRGASPVADAAVAARFLRAPRPSSGCTGEGHCPCCCLNQRAETAKPPGVEAR